MFWRENRIGIRSYAVAVYNVHCKDKQKKVWWDNFVLQNNCWHSISLHNLIVGLWLGQPATVKKGRILLTLEKMDGILILFINNFWFDRNKIREKNIVLHTENMDNSGLINFQPKFWQDWWQKIMIVENHPFYKHNAPGPFHGCKIAWKHIYVKELQVYTQNYLIMF